MYTYGFAGYPDARDGVSQGMRIGSLGGLNYVPDLAPTGSGAAYWPRDTKADRDALRYLGFYPEPWASQHTGTSGSQKADMNNGTGAWDSLFQDAVFDFQEATPGLVADRWIGQKTRVALAAAVAAKNAQESPIPIPPSPIPLPPNVLPGPPSNPSQPQNVSTQEGMPLTTKIGIGVGVLALLAGGAYLLSD